MDVESIAGTVGEEFGVVFGQHSAEPFQFDADAVVGRAIGRAVESESDDEDALVDAKLDGIAPAAVAPLIGSIGWRLETVAHLRFETRPRLAVVEQVGLVARRKVEEDVGRFLKRQDARLGRLVGKIFQRHGGEPDEKKSVA